MTIPCIHIIQRQMLEVTFQDRREGMGLPGHLTALSKERLLPVLEKVMDKLNLGDHVILLESLQLDIGELSSKNWEEEFIEKAGKQFENELREKLSASSGKKAEESNAGVHVFSGQESAWNNFLYFLENGVLPGAAQVISLNQLQEEVMGILPGKEYIKYSGQLKELLLNNENALERFLLQFSVELSDVALSAFGYSHSMDSNELLKNKLVSAKQQHMLDFCSRLQAAVRHNAPAPEKLVEKVLEGEQKQISSSAPVPKLTVIDHKDEKETDVCYITNSGLVLLHPFLQHLFLNLGYLNENKEWVSGEAHQQAVLLSQYLVTGEEEIPEYDLALNKILCGYPLEKFLENKLELTTSEKEEAAHLLATVIRHWQALKSTSVEVLRSTFLARN